jgi:hypothetical protein
MREDKMGKIKLAMMSATSSMFLIGSAMAADLTGPQLKELLVGKSVYLETTATTVVGAGRGVLYYAGDGAALYKTGSGRILHGKWSIKENTICIDWKEMRNNPCSRYDKRGDTITVFNVGTRRARGKVLKIADGNSEKIE